MFHMGIRVDMKRNAMVNHQLRSPEVEIEVLCLVTRVKQRMMIKTDHNFGTDCAVRDSNEKGPFSTAIFVFGHWNHPWSVA